MAKTTGSNAVVSGLTTETIRAVCRTAVVNQAANCGPRTSTPSTPMEVLIVTVLFLTTS